MDKEYKWAPQERRNDKDQHIYVQVHKFMVKYSLDNNIGPPFAKTLKDW